MANIKMEIELDKKRIFEMGYGEIKEAEAWSIRNPKATQCQAIEHSLYLALRKDDPSLKLSDMDEFIQEASFDYIIAKIDEYNKLKQDALNKKLGKVVEEEKND